MPRRLRPLGERQHPVTVQNPGTPTADGSGGYTLTYTNATPALAWAAVDTVSAAQEAPSGNAERAAITHVVEMGWHPEVTLTSRLVFRGRYLYVRGVVNVNEQDRDLVLSCEERA